MRNFWFDYSDIILPGLATLTGKIIAIVALSYIF